MRHSFIYFLMAIFSTTFINAAITNLSIRPRYEKWDPCPPSCPPEATCKQLMEGIVYPCPLNIIKPPCVPAFRCIDGYYRKKNGSCVKPVQCCDDPNAEFVSCPNPCPLTCDQRTITVCSKACLATGCQCKSGYLLHNGKCILPKNCPITSKCGTNEVYNACPGYCTFENDCFSMFSGIVRDCAAPPPDYQCSPRCECAPEFVRINATCVSPSLCPNSSCVRKNEIFTTCGSCDGTCTDPNPICTTVCRIGCFCPNGYVRNEFGDCIPQTECPPSIVCGVNEVLNKCPGYCTFEDDCLKKYGGLISECAAPPIDYQCYPRCDCAPNYVRIDGKCTSPEFCPNSTCTRGNEHFTTCGGCDGTCADPNPICTAVCRTGCFCLPGFVRDGGTCINQKNCP